MKGATTTADDALVYTIAETARRLGLSDDTVYGMATRGELPARKLGGQWRVSRAKLDEMFAAPTPT